MNEKELTHIDLFSGIGGFTLAGEWAGFKTIAFCEKDAFCQKVLQKHWPEVPIIPEIRDFDGTKWRGATLLTGGFPCQPFSVAGPRTGTKDDRYLWPQMFRVIKEAKPRWILAENVTGIVKLALGEVLSDLEGIGYDFPRDHEGTPIVPVIPACSLNAPHRRYRVWIIAHSSNDKHRGWSKIQADFSPGSNSHASDSESPECEQLGQTRTGRRRFADDPWQKDWHEVAAEFCRVDDGVPDRVHRLKALGNAIVPQIAYEILKNIAWIERNND